MSASQLCGNHGNLILHFSEKNLLYVEVAIFDKYLISRNISSANENDDCHNRSVRQQLDAICTKRT